MDNMDSLREDWMLFSIQMLTTCFGEREQNYDDVELLKTNEEFIGKM